jgi:hypothetical protein
MRFAVVRGLACLTIVAYLLAAPLAAGEPFTLAEADGYRGIWYAVGKTSDQYGYKYSGGMPTYPQQHSPIAVYVPAANKTFFVYGGSPPGQRRLLHMVSYFDHAARTVPRPRILLDKQTNDAHDNPTLAVDTQGYLWIFSNSHGTSRPSFIHRSAKPYAIDAFERVLVTNFSYGQPWVLDDGSFLLMHTRYKSGRQMWWITSRDGREWSAGEPLSHIGQGHYQQSWSDGRRVATAFNYHPKKGGLDARTNLYYLETPDAGKTWQNASGQTLDTPLAEIHNPALVRDYESEGLLVYLKQLRFDRHGRPVVLYQTSGGHEPGPANDPRTWRIARWDGRAWQSNDVTTSDHNYDFGSLYLDEPDGTWRLIAPTDPGPQPYTTGGQMVLWTSADEGWTWRKVKPLTYDKRYNHTFARQPLGAQADFYALWGDGDTLAPSESSLYFTDRAGTQVWRLPTHMSAATAAPEIAW